MREKERWLQKEWGRKGGCKRSRAEKVAAAEIFGKANPGNRGGFLKGRTDTREEEQERRNKRGGTGERRNRRGGTEESFSSRGLVGKRHSLASCLEEG